MNMKTVLLGKAVLVEKIQHSGPISTVANVRDLLKHVEEIRLGAGGSSTLEYPDVEPKSAFVDMYDKWRHNSCQVILNTDASVRQKGTSLSDTLRIHQKKKTGEKTQREVSGFARFAMEAKQKQDSSPATC
ncbi:hypothetical protein HPB51_016665 [Rhipicephalus microplus]|uniref:Uncharacterized protein n=1 Tax=Rhipicephalus microplus TaxID=6941 RepID=A0A9J6DPI8_RHIMP|nr:hypothetical protein HPB51_016665 [Rhipicephalus microplus]